jgi:hypothetical protein
VGLDALVTTFGKLAVDVLKPMDTDKRERDDSYFEATLLEVCNASAKPMGDLEESLANVDHSFRDYVASQGAPGAKSDETAREIDLAMSFVHEARLTAVELRGLLEAVSRSKPINRWALEEAFGPVVGALSEDLLSMAWSVHAITRDEDLRSSKLGSSQDSSEKGSQRLPGVIPDLAACSLRLRALRRKFYRLQRELTAAAQRPRRSEY